jgi:hypothetical protein
MFTRDMILWRIKHSNFDSCFSATKAISKTYQFRHSREGCSASLESSKRKHVRNAATLDSVTCMMLPVVAVLAVACAKINGQP